MCLGRIMYTNISYGETSTIIVPVSAMKLVEKRIDFYISNVQGFDFVYKDYESSEAAYTEYIKIAKYFSMYDGNIIYDLNKRKRLFDESDEVGDK